MTTDDFLVRLTAGLAEDERSARAALLGPARLESDWKVVTYEVELDDRQVQTVADSRGVFLAPELGRLSAHIARQCPKTTLDRVEALRRVITAYENAASAAASDVSSFARGQDDGFREALEFTVQSLASIYTNLTDETENA